MTAKPLTPELVHYLLSVKHADITMDFLRDNFAATKNPPKIDTASTFEISNELIGKYRLQVPKLKDSTPITTTAGRFIANYFMLGNELAKHFNYINEPWNSGVIKKIQKTLARKLMEGIATSEEQVEYINREEWFGFGIASFMSPSMSMAVVKPLKSVMKRKAELLEQHKEALARMDMAVIASIEKELIALAAEELKDEPSLEMYTSGAKGNMQNNYKTTCIMTGAMVESNDRSKFTFSSSNLSDGIQMKELGRYADQQISVAFDTAISTRDGGYIVKQFVAAFSHVTLDDQGTDCGTKYGLEITIDETAIDNYHLRYVKVNDAFVLLTEDNIKKLMGKKVFLRSPMYCTGEKICNKCAGEFYYRLGTRNIGGLLYKVGSQLLQAGLKSKHDKSIKTRPLNLASSLKPLKPL